MGSRSSYYPAILYYELEVVEGLEAIAWAEVRRRAQRRARPFAGSPSPSPGVVQIDDLGDPGALLELKSVNGAFAVLRLPIPRPRALLGDQYFTLITRLVQTVMALSDPGVFKSLYLSAAGSDSSVLLRFKDQLAHHTALGIASQEGDLLLRLRRPLDGSSGWELLVRLTPRPLSMRAWRICNFEGALNASVAHAMAILSQPRPGDRFLNLACGSGSLLIERRSLAPAREMVGVDLDLQALECAQTNLIASGFQDEAILIRGDGGALPLERNSVDALCADLPFGNLVGTHAANLTLYPRLFKEAGRVARPGARFVLISHEIRLVESLLADAVDWSLVGVVRINLRGLHPRIYLLRRR